MKPVLTDDTRASVTKNTLSFHPQPCKIGAEAHPAPTGTLVHSYPGVCREGSKPHPVSAGDSHGAHLPLPKKPEIAKIRCVPENADRMRRGLCTSLGQLDSIHAEMSKLRWLHQRLG